MASFIAVMFLDYFDQELSLGALAILLVISGLIMAGTIVLIGWLNRRHDEGEGIVQKNLNLSRWQTNALFASMIMILSISAGYQSGKQELLRMSTSSARLPSALAVFAIAAAGVIYLYNYHNYKPRMQQIRDTEKTGQLNRNRFVFLMEEIREDGRLKGKLQGEIHTGDQVFILRAGRNPVRSKVKKIFFMDRSVRKAADCDVILDVPFPKNGDEAGYEEFTVLSGVMPMARSLQRVTAENPRVSGMLCGVAGRIEDREFISTFIYDALHGNYLVPAKVSDEKEAEADITSPLKGSHDVMFVSVSSASDPEKAVFPVFTDWDALKRYQNVMDDPKTVVLLMTFPQIVQMIRKGYDGMVINPFGPASFFFSLAYIQSITQLQGYREEFLMNEGENHEE